jgi:hypothetical protein
VGRVQPQLDKPKAAACSKFFLHTHLTLLNTSENVKFRKKTQKIVRSGHCAGQVALLWRPGRMLFAGEKPIEEILRKYAGEFRNCPAAVTLFDRLQTPKTELRKSNLYAS